MRVAIALGSHALLRRGQPLTAANLRENARAAGQALAPIAREHEVVVSHGNSPQLGVLGLKSAAYAAFETYSLDLLAAQSQGMIGSVLQQELGNELRFDRPVATLLTQVEVRPSDPAFDAPDVPVGPEYSEGEAAMLVRHKGWAFSLHGASVRRVVPGPQPWRIVGVDAVSDLLGRGYVVICPGGGGLPVRVDTRCATQGARLVGVEAIVDQDLASARLAADLGADVLALVTDVDAVYADWGTPQHRAIRRAAPRALGAVSLDGESMRPKVRAACAFVEETGGMAAIGSIADAAALVRGEAGTVIGRGDGEIELAGPRTSPLSVRRA
jgi:carbamate kinase